MNSMRDREDFNFYVAINKKNTHINNLCDFENLQWFQNDRIKDIRDECQVIKII